MSVRAVGEQDEDAIVLGIDPDTRASEAVMSEAVRRKPGAARRILRRCQLPSNRTRFFQTRRHVLAKQSTCLRLQQLRRVAEKLLGD